VVQALCICPTRELVIQNLQVLSRMAKYTSITALSTATGSAEGSRCSSAPSAAVLSTGVCTAVEHMVLHLASLFLCRRERVTEQVVIGTHGRLHQWMNRRLLPARNLKILVFDEADEMLKV
jgi:ATP-dependent RNA helicase DDX19/DBP5